MNFPFFANRFGQSKILLFAIAILLLFSQCNSHQTVSEKEMVEKPEEINQKAEDLIKATLEAVMKDPAHVSDSIKVKNAPLVQELYQKNNFLLFWSSDGVFTSQTDSLLVFINSSMQYGLLPKHYYAPKLNALHKLLQTDTVSDTRLDAAQWAYTDMLCTSAFVQLVKDLKMGRLLADSVLIKDSSVNTEFINQQYSRFSKTSLTDFANELEPDNKDYQQLKIALQNFLPSANMRSYTLVKTKDSLLLPKLVYKRISEEDSIKLEPVKNPDSVAVAQAIKKYQKFKKLKQDGRISTPLIQKLNNTDKEKFFRIALTMDKYKMLPKLPGEYIWVNLPGYILQVRQGDSVVLTSKIICGKSETQTPQLTSVITDMITYPQWTIPESIIKKEILPGLKKNAGYTEKKGYSLVDSKGNEVSPYSITWAKYKTGIPYKVVQGSGDANALGILKFNFSNPYAVYLHDTNQRYLFDRTSRALSHGCVRVHKWRELAYYILRKDSIADFSKATPIDSLNAWLAEKKKKYIRVHQRLPLFIRYFSCEGKAGKLVLHDDIYEEDRRLREKIFAKD